MMRVDRRPIWPLSPEIEDGVVLQLLTSTTAHQNYSLTSEQLTLDVCTA